MLALILLACNGPTRERFVCDPQYGGNLFVRAYEELAVAPDPEAGCVRTQTLDEGYAGYDVVPVSGASYARFETEPAGAASVPAGLLDGFPEVGVGPEIRHLVVEYGTRHGVLFPDEEDRQVEDYREPVRAEEDLTSTVVTPLGVELVGRGAGLLSEDPTQDGRAALVVRCSDCEVFVPYAPTALRLQLERAVLHLCFEGSVSFEGSVTDTVVHAEQPTNPYRRVLQVDGTVDFGDERDFTELLANLESARRLDSTGLCR